MVSGAVVLRDLRMASVTEMLNTLQWNTLEKRRNCLRIVLLYKIIHNKVEINAQEQLVPRSTSTRGHFNKFIQLQTKVDPYKNSFFPFTIKLWNQLDDHIAQASLLDLLYKYLNL